MKVIIHEHYIIPISSISFIEKIYSRSIRVYFNRPIDDHTSILLRYDSACECLRAHEHIAHMFSE